MRRVAAIVPAAGAGARMKLKVKKTFLEVRRRPILLRTLAALEVHPEIEEITLVSAPDDLEEARRLVKAGRLVKVARVIAGGATRKDSVRNGLEVIPSRMTHVLIHDGVRPFVDEATITRVIDEAERSGAAVAGVPIKPTIKRVSVDLEVEETLKREHLWEIQTPQVFDRELIQTAYLRAAHVAAPDDAALVEAMGRRVRVVMGSYFNIKITTPEDLVLAESIAAHFE